MAKVNEYLAKKIMKDLRYDEAIDDDVLKELIQVPHIDYIRAEVNDSDIDTLLKLASIRNEVSRSFAIALLSKVKDNECVKEFILESWNNANDSEIMLKMDLLWRLLDYPDIKSALHEEIYKFIRENWTCWIKDVEHSYGGTDNILDNIKKRLVDHNFPETKKWIYLCVSVTSSDIKGVRELLSEHENNTNPFVTKVVQDLQLVLKSKENL